ncbi:uncharacterized protein LOC144167761 [Haemaphysalis longicornis]
MDRSVSPCEDFDRFVCANSAHVLRELRSRVLRAAAGRLARTAIPREARMTAQQKAASLYQLCAHVASLEEDAAPQLSGLLGQLGLRWPKEQPLPGFAEEAPPPSRQEAAELLFELLALSLRWALHTLVRCQVEPNNGSAVLAVRASEELSKWLQDRDELLRLQAYDRELSAVVGAFSWPQTADIVRTVATADSVLGAVVSNASLWSGARMDFDTWREAASKAAGQAVTPYVQPSKLLPVVEYLVLNMTGVSSVVAAWLLIRAFVPSNKETRSERCIQLVERELPLAVASAYALVSDSAANASTVDAADELVHNVAAGMAGLLEASGQFRRAGLLRRVQARFILPESDVATDLLYVSVPAADPAHGFFGSLARATNAMADSRLAALGSKLEESWSTMLLFARPLVPRLRHVGGTLLVPMAALEPPIFRQTLTGSVNYGAFGRIVAQALIEMFVGRPNTTKACGEAVGNWTDTLLRDAAVERPVQRAFQVQASHATNDVRLLGFQDLSSEQTFFIAGCYTRCGSGASCSAAFRHNRWFTAAFGCSRGAPLNPEHKCGFW